MGNPCHKCGAKRGHLPGCDDWGIPTVKRKRGPTVRRGKAPKSTEVQAAKCQHKRTRTVQRKGRDYTWCTDCHNWIGSSP